MRNAISILAAIIFAYAAPVHALELCADLKTVQDYLKTSDFIDEQTRLISQGGSKRQLSMLYLKRGIAHLQTFQDEKALADCSKAIQLAPGFADAYNARACVRTEGVNTSDADLEKAIRDFTSALNLVQDSNGYINRGRSYVTKKEYDRAVADYTKAIAIKPASSQAYNGRGRAYEGKRDLEKAVADYTTALKIDPQCLDAYQNRGKLFFRKQDYDRAIEDFTKAIRLGPSDISAYFISIDRGDAYTMKESFDEAIADYTEAIRLKSDYTFAYNSRGFAYLAKGDYKKALSDYSRIITIDPKSAFAYSARVWSGNIYRARFDYDRALEEYTEAARSNSKQMEAYYGRGSVYYSRGDYDRAFAEYSQAIEAAPQFERSYLHLVDVSCKLSDEYYQLSLKKLRDYVNNSPSDEWIRTVSGYYLGFEGITEETVLNEAKKEKNAFARRMNLCEACYYLGAAQLGKGNRIRARKFFNRSVDTKSYASGEFYMSQALLKQIGKGRYLGFVPYIAAVIIIVLLIVVLYVIKVYRSS